MSKAITPTESNRLMGQIVREDDDWEIDTIDQTEALDLLLAIARQHGHKGAANKFEASFRSLFMRARVNLGEKPLQPRVFPVLH